MTTAKPRYGSFGLDLTAIDKSVKPATSGQDIVTHLEQLKVPTK